VSSVDDVLPNTLGAVLAALVTRRWWRTESLVGAKRCRSHPV
jgi:glycopeptide antibiotics resistance protein